MRRIIALIIGFLPLLTACILALTIEIEFPYFILWVAIGAFSYFCSIELYSLIYWKCLLKRPKNNLKEHKMQDFYEGGPP